MRYSPLIVLVKLFILWVIPCFNVRTVFFTELMPLFSENSKCYFRRASIYMFFVKLTVPFKNVCFKIDFRLRNFGI